MKKPYLRLIGDTHGKIDEYILLANQAENSIQIGDLGFDYQKLNDLDSIKHRVLAGNHDNYEMLNGVFHKQTPHFLGDYGVHSVSDIGEFFFVRGGYSIDKDYRIEGKTWFPEEQISYGNCLKALEEYVRIKPKFVISHECPSSIINYVAGFKTWGGQTILPSMTATLLEQMFFNHTPELWIFGHHHKFFDMIIEGTRFVCLPELGVLDFDKN